MLEERTPVVYEFSRAKVERGDFSHFLGTYSLDRLPTGRRLRAMMDNMIFTVSGYDSDPRGIYMIPEVRQFYRKFRGAWPYWFYFCNLDQDALKPMALSCLEHVATLQTAAEPERVRTESARVEFARFLAQNLGSMNVICDRAKMFERLIYDRSKAVFEYFGLPYEAERPA